MKLATAVVIADSISDQGIRITTFQLRYWRAIHAELMTHRVFSRNAGSSRARPSKAIIEQVAHDPWGPIVWGLNEPGMQANNLADISVGMQSLWSWRNIAKRAANSATVLLNLGLHKQIVNRVLEPFTYIDVVVTATDYANWFALRLDEDAQPEIQQLAQAMESAMAASAPAMLKPGEWHLPYITVSDHTNIQDYPPYVITNNKDIDISIYFKGLQKLINNPEYGNRVGMNVKDKKIWRGKSEEFIIPAGETRKIYKVMVGAYTYSVMNTLHTQKIANGDVDVPQCTEDMIEIN